MEAAVALDPHQVLRGEQAQRLAHDADAHAEPLAELGRLEALPRGEAAVEDVGSQLVIDVDGEALAACALGHVRIISLGLEIDYLLTIDFPAAQDENALNVPGEWSARAYRQRRSAAGPAGPFSAGLDVEKASDGRFSGDPQAIFGQWDEFREWAARAEGRADLAISPAELGAPAPAPRQVFAIGLNYAEHVNESGMGRPDSPTVFTKFPSSITGPNATVELPSGAVDWEVELVVAIGRQAYRVSEDAAYGHVAGFMVGQDLSERVVQLAGPGAAVLAGQVLPRVRADRPRAGHGGRDRAPRRPRARLPAGRRGAAARADPRPDVQRARADLAAVRHLPAAARGHHLHRNPVGGRQRPRPKRFIPPGGVLTSHIEGVGELRNDFVAGPGYESSQGGD